MDPEDVVGVAPMAGRGTRLGLTGSKEIVPLAGAPGGVLSSVMLTRMAQAGMRHAVLTVADHKADIREYYGKRFGEHLALHYVSANESPNTPTSIDAGYEFYKGKVCALGFADILYRPCGGYARALGTLARTGADVVLGLFPTEQPTTSDMVAFDATGEVRKILIKREAGARYFYTWSMAVWQPVFSDFMRDWLRSGNAIAQAEGSNRAELFVGDAVIAAQAAGLKVHAAVVSTLGSLDAGTPESLALARSIDWG